MLEVNPISQMFFTAAGELYETDPSKENAMPLSAKETMRRMMGTTFCVAPTGDSDGFTQRFYYIIAAGCIPVRVDTYYSDRSFGRVAWPFKQTVQWKKAVLLLPPGGSVAGSGGGCSPRLAAARAMGRGGSLGERGRLAASAASRPGGSGGS